MRSRLASLASHTPDEPHSLLVNLTGTAGIGKSHALRQLDEISQAQGLPTIWVDFDAQRESLIGRAAQPISALVAELAQLEPLRYLSPPEGPASEAALRFQLRDLARVAGSEGEHRPPLIMLLDHLDDLSYWKWIQQELIKPAIEQYPTLVVCTSSTPLYWNFWELRRLCVEEPIATFSESETQQFLQLHKKPLLSVSAYALTQGYPLKLRSLVESLESGFDAEGAPGLFRDLEAWLARFPPDIQRILPLLTVQRTLDVETILRVLDAVSPGWAGNREPFQVVLSHILPRLAEHGALAPYRRGQPYRIEPIYRATMMHDLRERDPERYAAVRRILAEHYAARFADRPIEEAQALNEWLYVTTLEPLDQAQRDAWLDAADDLLERGSVAGSRLVVQFYRDTELLHRLDSHHLFAAYQKLLARHVGDDTSAQPILNATEAANYRRRLIEQLASQPPLSVLNQQVPHGLVRLLETIRTIGREFDIAALQERFEALSPPDEAPLVSPWVALLHSSGLAEYRRDERRYRLTDLAWSLASDEPS